MKTGRVITASNRAASGVYTDRSGPVVVAWLRERGYDCPDPAVVPDGEPVGDALRAVKVFVGAAIGVVLLGEYGEEAGVRRR